MLSTAIVMVYFGTFFAGVYIFDYRVDGVINNPIVIISSFLAGFVVTVIFIFLFLETTYIFIARRKPKTSRLKHFIGKQIVSVPMHFANLKTKVYGMEHLPKDTSFLIYSNHTSELDISVLMCHLKHYPIAFLAKQAVREYPSIGRWAQSIGCVMLNRDDNRQGSQAVMDVVENVKNGLVMVVFPEGKVSREIGALEKFRSGSFKIALESGVPLVPVTLVKEMTYNQKKWPRCKRLDIVIHPPLLPDSYHALSSRQLGLKVRDIISSSLRYENKKT